MDLNNNFDQIAEIVNKNEIEIIYNFIAQSMVEQSWINPDHWYETNVVGLSKLCNLLMTEPSIERFIHFTTPEVYGSVNGWVSETFNFRPSTPYAISRAAGDWHLRCLFEQYRFPVIFVRTANVYGPGQQLYRIIPKAILSALAGKKLPLHGNGQSIRSFIHIDDVTSALLLITLNGNLGETYHISTKTLTSTLELVNKIAVIMKSNAQDLIEIKDERIGKDFAYQLSSDKIRYKLGWNDKMQLDEGIKTVVKWAESNLETLNKFPDQYLHKR
jgi:dTDP-glucose 4,6-dehydratase